MHDYSAKIRNLLFRMQAKLYPEMRYFPDSEFGREIMQQAFIGDWSKAVFWILNMVLPLVIGVASLFLYKFIARRFDLDLPYGIAATLMILLPLYCILYTVPTRKRIRRQMRQRLQEIHIPICLECGYDLRGQEQARCPECGREFDPGLLRGGEK